jgi:hypothetical protein
LSAVAWPEERVETVGEESDDRYICESEAL